MSDELKPCPFCGQAATRRVRIRDSQSEVGCSHCLVWLKNEAVWQRRVGALGILEWVKHLERVGEK